MPINSKEKREREDIYIGNKIDSKNLLENLSYEEFIIICISFTEKFIVTLSKNLSFKEDIYYVSLFTKGKINQEVLRKRRIDAWSRYDLLEGKDRYIQRVIICFLYPDIINSNNEGIDDFQELFLNLLLDIKDGLCIMFFDFLSNHAG